MADGQVLINSIFSFHLFIIVFAATSAIARSDDCVYTLYVRTGSIIKGGTNSKISATVFDRDGWGIRIDDIELWGGLMGQDYDYFERGNLDIFSGRGPCLDAPICALNLTSDGSGPNHGWYCNYVEITSTGPHMGCSQQLFTVEQWLATDTSPYELTAIRDYCSSYVSNPRDGRRDRRSYVSNPRDGRRDRLITDLGLVTIREPEELS